MLNIEVKIKDHDKVQLKLDRMKKNLVPILFQILVDNALKTRNTMIKSMEESPPLGRTYRSRKKGKMWHIASAPGYPPRVDTGDLIASIIPDVREGELEVEVGSIITSPPYPSYLEKGVDPLYGTQLILPRPYAWPALEAVVPEIKNDITKAIVNLL